jgi:hypothetical protein
MGVLTLSSAAGDLSTGGKAAAGLNRLRKLWTAAKSCCCVGEGELRSDLSVLVTLAMAPFMSCTAAVRASSGLWPDIRNGSGSHSTVSVMRVASVETAYVRQQR